MEQKTKAELEAIKVAAKVQMLEQRAEIERILAENGYEVMSVFELFEDELLAYAQNEGYHYCDSCDERRGDGDRGF
ncbi:MAG: hypothetical protein WC648_05165 [Candidatus Paceibacterota bacterium]